MFGRNRYKYKIPYVKVQNRGNKNISGHDNPPLKKQVH